MNAENHVILSAIIGAMMLLMSFLFFLVIKLRRMHRRDKIMQRLLRYTHDAPIIMRMGK